MKKLHVMLISNLLIGIVLTVSLIFITGRYGTNVGLIYFVLQLVTYLAGYIQCLIDNETRI